MNANTTMSFLKLWQKAHFHKKVSPTSGSFALRTPARALPIDPTGARPPDSNFCPHTLNDLPPPMYEPGFPCLIFRQKPLSEPKLILTYSNRSNVLSLSVTVLLVMAALHSRCGHYIFALWFLLLLLSLWPPCVADADIIFMVALWNRADHDIFALWFLSFIFFSFLA